MSVSYVRVRRREPRQVQDLYSEVAIQLFQVPRLIRSQSGGDKDISIRHISKPNPIFQLCRITQGRTRRIASWHFALAIFPRNAFNNAEYTGIFTRNIINAFHVRRFH